jgi:hypothetical protein
MRRGFLVKKAEEKPKPLDNLAHGGNLRLIPSAPSLTRPSQTSPFANTPADVLLHIFSMTIKSEAGDRYRWPHTSTTPLAFRLSHISSFVRQLVLGVPSFWTTIDNRVVQSDAMTDVYIIRSRDCWLDINITDDYGCDRHDTVQRFKKLVAHIHRWRRLRFFAEHISDEEFGELFEPLRMASAPNLVHLDIGSISDVEESPTTLRRILAGGTPTLKTLRLMSNSFCLPTGFGALTRFRLLTLPGHLPSLTYISLCTALVAMCSLTHLQLIGQVVCWPTVKAVKPIILPALQCLDLNPSEDYDAGFIEAHCVSSLFATFTAPSLQQLSLSYLPSAILKSFLKNLRNGTFCFPHVKSLAWWTALKSDQIATIVQSFPALESLTLMDCPGDNLLEALLAHDNDPSSRSPLWPCLCRLNIYSSIKLSNLRAYVASRIRWEKPIREVRLHESLLRMKRDPHLDWLCAALDLKFWSYDIFAAEGSGWEID